MNKIYVIGYLLHRYKSAERAMGIWVMENKITNSDESSGGSGKSFMINFLENFKRVVTLNGRSKMLTEDRFFMDRVDEYTDLLNIDDAQQYFDFSQFYPSITGNMPVGRKALKTLEIKFKDSPKIIFTSNFPPPTIDASTMRRLLICVFSDYYHKQTEENGYLENRSIADDFGYALHNENYKEEYWNEDFNFLADCLHFYLSCVKAGIICEAPSSNIQKRIWLNLMTDSFHEWASVKFNSESDYLDKYVEKSLLFNQYKNDVKSGWTSHKFSKALRAFASYYKDKYTLNPSVLCDKDGRIIKKVGEQTKEFIYLKTNDCSGIKDYELETRITL